MATAVPIDPPKLIEAAREFADRPGVLGRPRPIWLRRSVSSSYYGLFHCIGKQAAAHMLAHASSRQQLAMVRSFDHRALKEVCEWIAGRRGGPPQHGKPLIDSLKGTVIADVAAVFCDLQEARHRADYDHLEPFSKASALGYVQDAELAIRKLSRAHRRNREMFFTLISLRTSLR